MRAADRRRRTARAGRRSSSGRRSRRPDVGLDADPVDRPHEVAVRQRVADLLDAPEVLGQAPAGGRRDEHDLGAVEPQGAGALREVAVVADVDADLADGGLEDRVAEVAGPEVELLPEALDVGDVRLAVLAQVRAVAVDDRGGVVVEPVDPLVLLVHRDDEDHAGLPREVLHPLRRRAVRDALGVGVVLPVLDLAEVGTVEELLEEHELGALLRRLVGVALVLLDHRLLVAGPGRLQERASDDTGHRGHLRWDGSRRLRAPRDPAEMSRHATPARAPRHPRPRQRRRRRRRSRAPAPGRGRCAVMEPPLQQAAARRVAARRG